MKARSIFVATLFLPVLFVAPVQGQEVAAQSKFHRNADGWGSTPNWDARHRADNGYTPGFMKLEDRFDGTTFLKAPASYHGDYRRLSRTTGPACSATFRPGHCDGMLVFYHRILRKQFGAEFDPYSVILSGPGGSATWKGEVPERPTVWRRIKVPIRKNHWVVTSGTWEALIAEVTDLQIQIELASNDVVEGHFPDHEGVDDVRLLYGTEEPRVFCPQGC